MIRIEYDGEGKEHIGDLFTLLTNASMQIRIGKQYIKQKHGHGHGAIDFEEYSEILCLLEIIQMNLDPVLDFFIYDNDIWKIGKNAVDEQPPRVVKKKKPCL